MQLYDRVEFKVGKGRKKLIQSHAASLGESLNAFVNRAIDEAVERDGGNSVHVGNEKELRAEWIKRLNRLTDLSADEEQDLPWVNWT